jgi:hypothetical protein
MALILRKPGNPGQFPTYDLSTVRGALQNDKPSGQYEVGFCPVTGRLREETYTSIFQDCLLVKVNKQDYDGSYTLTQSPLGIMGITRGNEIVFQAYKLGAEDCVAFMIDVAKILQSRRLHVPARNTLERPFDYLQRLVGAN